MVKSKIKYSIIIPTLNEEEYIGNLLSAIMEQSKDLTYKIEIIVIDGDSSDKTLEIAKNYDVVLLKSSKGRGVQFGKGADIAKGEIFIFLHADLKIPQNLFSYLDHQFNSSIDVATFRMKLNGDNLLYKVYSFFTKFDSIFSTFGDQGIIVRKIFYNKIGGFKPIPIMEDLDFLRRARSQAKIKKFNKTISPSTRRFKNVGIIKTQLSSLKLILMYLFGADPIKLYKKYYTTNYEKIERSTGIFKISSRRKSKNQISFNNK